MAFPINPTTGITHDINGRVWSFNGYAWERVSTAAGSTGATPTEIALNDLTDVVIVGATTNDILYYIGSTWINKPFNEILVDGGLF